MVRRLSLLILLILFIQSATFSYSNKKAILYLNKELQHDSFGYNFVSSFLSWIYKAVEEGKIKLYDSPLKSNEISFLSLKSMEESFQLKFLNSSNLFIYENWSSNSTSTSFNIIGFSITSESKEKGEISFGFISYEDISDQLKIAIVKAGITGYYNTTFHQVLMNKLYSYDLIFFDDQPIINSRSDDTEKAYQKGNRIKSKAFNPGKNNLNEVAINPIKLITYSVYKSDYDYRSTMLFSALQNYFDMNKKSIQLFGGDLVYSNFKYSRMIISECNITELVIKNNETITFQLINIQPVAMGMTLHPIPLAAIDTFNILVDDKLLGNFIISKNYSFRLKAINENPIPEKLSEKYMDAILKGEWNSLSQIAKP